MTKEVGNVADAVVAAVSTYGLQVIGAFLILIAGWIAAKSFSGIVNKSLQRVSRVDPMLRGFIVSLTRWGILAFTIIAVLENFVVETTSLVALLGAAGLAIGLALQGTLSHLAAGAMLLLFRPFKIGDFIECGGLSGSVKDLTLFVTHMTTPDNVEIIVPNGQIWGSPIRNFSHNPNRRLDMTVGIGYKDDIGKALAVLQDLLGADARVFADPAPFLAVSNLGDSAVEIVIRVWCVAGDYWPLKFDLNRRIKEAFDAEGISIPFPQREIHIVNSASN
ncbi:MAG: mechanosensitive ion channel family protein [Magnetospiraceae bacterium]